MFEKSYKLCKDSLYSGQKASHISKTKISEEYKEKNTMLFIALKIINDGRNI